MVHSNNLPKLKISSSAHAVIFSIGSPHTCPYLACISGKDITCAAIPSLPTTKPSTSSYAASSSLAPSTSTPSRSGSTSPTATTRPQALHVLDTSQASLCRHNARSPSTPPPPSPIVALTTASPSWRPCSSMMIISLPSHKGIVAIEGHNFGRIVVLGQRRGWKSGGRCTIVSPVYHRTRLKSNIQILIN